MKDIAKLLKRLSFYPILFLESYLPVYIRKKIVSVLKIFSILLGTIFVFAYFLGHVSDVEIIVGIFAILFAFLVSFLMLNCFFNSLYLGNESKFIAGMILFNTHTDIVKSFFDSRFGNLFLLRAEISKEEVGRFLSERKNFSLSEVVNGYEDDVFPDILELMDRLLLIDKEFYNFMTSVSIDKDSFHKINKWILDDFIISYNRELWWSPEYLQKISGIGKDWSFGHLFYVLKYCRDLALELEDKKNDFDVKEFKNEVRQLESILSKDRESNVIIVGEPGAGVFEMIMEFVKKLKAGKVSSRIEHKKAFFLNWNDLISTTKTKPGFEGEMIKILNESGYSGNVILVIDDLPGFISSANSIGSDIVSIMDPYLGFGLQVIATSDPIRFHKIISTNASLMRRFDKMIVEEANEDKTMEIMKNTIRKIESKRGVFFSYSATLEMVRSSVQYFPGNVLPDGALDILFEILGTTYSTDNYVSREDILQFVEMKTKIPLGKLETTERDKLLNLETILHERVVGQEEAITVVSNAMRRARANIRNVKKPVGAFLFLGPTGVGKTETAKALAEIFFGDEKYMLRLDMTEYQKGDSVVRMIGSFDSGKPGVLSTLIRDNPYGVLLLDEFEKADKDVHNLFLQILDEGFFSDMNGKKVSLRNIIIIATSNASSELIFEMVRRGKNLLDQKEEIIDKIVNTGVFRPELINRFDATVIFHPLSFFELKKIAGLMLKKLKKRLSEKGIELLITENVSSAVAEMGSNEIFGARPMTRFIQDKIEEPIARKIISGEVSGGSQIEIDPKDFKK